MAATQTPDIFSRSEVDKLKARIQRLVPDTRPQWGRMNAAQMLAHASKPYDTLYDAEYQRRYPPHTGLMRLLLKWLVKPLVVGPRQYKPNTRTAPSYVVADERDLVREREKLFGYLDRVQAEGRSGFEGRLSYSFGPLTADEWNVLFYKHLDHHLRQFGV
ncbi:MAG: hypothetical protein R2811_07195 [Flavobacteriales bacterium]